MKLSKIIAATLLLATVLGLNSCASAGGGNEGQTKHVHSDGSVHYH